VDVTLEDDLHTVQQGIDAYLQNPTAAVRKQLLTVLERLDDQIDRSDAYEGSIRGSAAFGYSSKGSVIGETSSASAAEQIPGPVLQAQTVLIKAAKEEVTVPTPETLAQLRAANDAFAQACRQGHSTP
jgi:hypothetical protein